jgi:ribosomal 50S subunit-associated protein YjgA (DUF615 family)
MDADVELRLLKAEAAIGDMNRKVDLIARTLAQMDLEAITISINNHKGDYEAASKALDEFTGFRKMLLGIAGVEDV